MRRKVPLVVYVAVLCAALSAAPAAAHWFTGDPYKWVQMPDLATTGLDVRAASTHVLGDDFRCTVTGPLTDIHIWGSWWHDILPSGDAGSVSFVLSIQKDVPAGTGGVPYSRPGEVIWSRLYAVNQFTWRLHQQNLQEGWFAPPSTYESYGDSKCYQYNFQIPAGELRQTGTEANPKTYWLCVQAYPQGTGALYGIVEQAQLPLGPSILQPEHRPRIRRQRRAGQGLG